MQISFDPNRQDEREAVALIIETLDGGEDAKQVKRTRAKKSVDGGVSASITTAASTPTVAAPLPQPTGPAPAAVAPVGMPAPAFTGPAPIAAPTATIMAPPMAVQPMQPPVMQQSAPMNPSMPPVPSFLDRAGDTSVGAANPALPQHQPIAGQTGVTQLQVTQAISQFTTINKVPAAKLKLAEFATTYGLPQPLAIDAIPAHLFAAAVEHFKV